MRHEPRTIGYALPLLVGALGILFPLAVLWSVT